MRPLRMPRLSVGVCAPTVRQAEQSDCSQGHVLTGSFGGAAQGGPGPGKFSLNPLSVQCPSGPGLGGRVGEVAGQQAVQLGAHHRKGTGKTCPRPCKHRPGRA